VKQPKWIDKRGNRQDACSTARGFTAIEISMVVTVIAILALLIMPLFRDRIEAARKTAAQDELLTLEKAETLAHADTGYYFRLQDLDNMTQYNEPPQRVDQEIPITSWNRPFTVEERRKLRGGPTAWKGPYITIGQFKFMELGIAVDPTQGIPEFFWSYTGRGGPILDLTGTDWWPSPNIPITWDHQQDKVLVDPWGTPYLFFGTGAGDMGKLNEEGGAYLAQETNFGNAAVYCLGPDGMPGDAVPYQGAADRLLRELGIIGTGDDYYRLF